MLRLHSILPPWLKALLDSQVKLCESQVRLAESKCWRKELRLQVGLSVCQCLIDFFVRRMSLVSSDSTCFNRREDKMLSSINICAWIYNYLQLLLFVQKPKIIFY